MKNLAQQLLIDKILKAKSIVLSTHRESDGDGLGCEVALYLALKKINKNVRILNVDPVPRKYDFLQANKIMQFFEEKHVPLQSSDLCLIFDTNDHRLLGDLFQVLEEKCSEIVFIDHHPELVQGPRPTPGSLLLTEAASTGEIVYGLIKDLSIPLDEQIASALYSSIAFDTNLFRYIRNSPKSHLICAELMNYKIPVEQIHRHLFGNHTIEKTAFVAKTLTRIEYFGGGKIAFVKVSDHDLIDHGLNTDETRDVIDMIMNIDSIEAAVLIREDSSKNYKISLRSKGKFDVLQVAEALGGGGHFYAAGAYGKGPFDKLKKQTMDLMLKHFKLAS